MTHLRSAVFCGGMRFAAAGASPGTGSWQPSQKMEINKCRGVYERSLWLSSHDPSMSRKRRVGAALCILGSMKWLSSVRAEPFDTIQHHYLLPNAQMVCNKPHDPTTLRVAVIGAGAAGSSSAWWMHLASDRLGRPIEVEVFEQADYIGGRR